MAIFRPESFVTEELCHPGLCIRPLQHTHDTTHDTTRHSTNPSFTISMTAVALFFSHTHPSMPRSALTQRRSASRNNSPLLAQPARRLLHPPHSVPTSVAARGDRGRGREGKGLTACEIPVDGLLGHTMQPLHVILTVPDPQLLPRANVTAGAEVNPLAVLEGHQVLLPLLPGDDHVPEGEATRQA